MVVVVSTKPLLSQDLGVKEQELLSEDQSRRNVVHCSCNDASPSTCHQRSFFLRPCRRGRAVFDPIEITEGDVLVKGGVLRRRKRVLGRHRVEVGSTSGRCSKQSLPGVGLDICGSLVISEGGSFWTSVPPVEE